VLASPISSGPVVVGCDGSWQSDQAVRAATKEAARRNADLVLLTVADQQPYWPDTLSWVVRRSEEAMEAATAVAERAMSLAASTDPSVPKRVLLAQDFETPELAAATREAGLLVLGTHGSHGQIAFALGSASEQLIQKFHCAVLVPQDRARSEDTSALGRPATVVAAIRMSALDGSVLAIAGAEAAVRGARLIVLHALPVAGGVDRSALVNGWRLCRDILRSAELPSGLLDRLVVSPGDPAEVLLNRVGPGDVLVIGTRGGGRLAGLVTGSVSRAVLDAMPCDVMVVPPQVLLKSPNTAVPTAYGAERV
jgi:nucleotide-binding universal stress UspA family protein